MAQKFLTNVELEAGLVDGSNSAGTSGYLLSSTGTATSWVDPAAVSVGESEQVHIACKNTSGVTISKGDPVYITGTVGNSFRIQIAKADASVPTKMPAVGLAETDLGINDEGFVIVSGVLKNLNTDPLSTGDGTPLSNDTVYVKAGGGLTKTKPTGSGNLIQNVGKVGRISPANAGSLAVSTIMRTNDVPNLTTGKIWVGSPTYTTESTVVHLDEANGRMGIGTTSPARRLDVRTGSFNSAVAQFTGANNGRGLLISTFQRGSNDDSVDFNAQYSGLGAMTFSIASSERMRINHLGNVGIGTISPSRELDVQGAVNIERTGAGGADDLLNVGGSGNGGIRTRHVDGKQYNSAALGPLNLNYYSSDDVIMAFGGGNVGIGTAGPSEKLEVNGNVKASSFIKDGGTSNQFLKADGSVDTTVYASKEESDSIFTSKTLSQNISFGESYASNYRSRVLDYGGIFFPRPLGYEIGLMKEKELFQKAKLSLLPSGVGVGNIHNLKPKNDTFNFTRNSTATYVDEDGIIAVAPINTPRINYPMIDGVVGGCPSLLLEPQRTNLITHSEDFNNWAKINTTIDSNVEVSPDGEINASRINFSASNSSSFIRFGSSSGDPNGRSFTNSIYLKSDSVNSVKIGILGSSTGLGYIQETLALTNEWQRFDVSQTFSGSGDNVRFRLLSTEVGSVFAWGAQLEEGSYPTSYIPTNGSTVTRVAETANGAGDANTFNDSEGVLFAEISALVDGGSTRVISLSGGSESVNNIYINFNPSGGISCQVLTSGGSNNLSIANINQTDVNKIAVKYKANDFALWLNGIKVDTDTTLSSTPTGLDRLNFDFGAGSFDFYGKTKQIQYFDSALTDQELQQLTSL